MGKKREPSESAVKKSSRKSSEVEEAVEDAKYESDLVKLKKENLKVMNKAVSKMETEIK